MNAREQNYPHNGKVRFNRRERDLGELLAAAMRPKLIADHLEIAPSTCHERIEAMCLKAKVADRGELMLYIYQNPGCLDAGAANEPGLHAGSCGCGAPGCLGRINERLRTG
jgi:DNA-binding CsgD family transcriptional regulator